MKSAWSLLLAVPALAAPVLWERENTVPSYVWDYAPLVWLASDEQWFPGPISEQLLHTVPKINFQPVTDGPNPLTLSNLGELNSKNGSNIYLSSKDDFTKFPDWLRGTKPDSTGKVAGDPSHVVVFVDNGNDLTTAFYLQFYPFNQGNQVFGDDAGDHVGDWEHNAVRFNKGVPESVWFSQHSGGQAFQYSAVEKLGKRPISYSAKGSHANYAKSGTHDHTIPNLNLPFPFFLTDYTSAGTIWDPLLNTYVYSYSLADQKFTPFDTTPSLDQPTSWLEFEGKWGDDELPKSDPRQHYFLGIELTAKFTGGPTGPRDKSLNRDKICPNGKSCTIRSMVTAK